MNITKETTPMEIIVQALKEHKTVIYQERNVTTRCIIQWDDKDNIFRTFNGDGAYMFSHSCPILALMWATYAFRLRPQTNLWKVL
jgi:hypothetical protein